MSAFVKKIQFKLHESYGNPLRGEYTLTGVWDEESEWIRFVASCRFYLFKFKWKCDI